MHRFSQQIFLTLIHLFSIKFIYLFKIKLFKVITSRKINHSNVSISKNILRHKEKITPIPIVKHITNCKSKREELDAQKHVWRDKVLAEDQRQKI